MQRFYFNVFDRVSKPDKIGIEFLDWRLAQREAIRLAGELIAAGSTRDHVIDDWSMSVTDKDGLILLRLDFVVGYASAVAHARTDVSAESKGNHHQSL